MKLSKNPAIWMVPDEASKALINDEHMADLACKVKQGDRVIVDPGNRKAEVRFVGKIPEIGKGYWVGVQYDDPVGRNDGSVKGRRCFECTHDFGGFLRPNHIRIDPTPPARKGQKVVAATGLDEKLGADDGKSRKPRKPRAVTKDSEMSFDWKKPDEPAKETGLATAVALVPSTEPMDTMADKGGKRTKQGQVVLATKISKPVEAKPSEIRPTDAIPAEVKESPNPVKPALASRKESSVKEKRLSVVNAPKIK
ncbi:tubulin folding cofactor b [Chrysochromulina tobinii]|uniref:Tubulin folding cofactor b n=1 Tax=Chrysochromulina tobinii TaxID=1460289 RepID=A0A0M0J4M6_9EUKA|nr:tubulin folding cofactor b [Chrysochromulina tobinii]|eukprot:KOO21521.1 tubulin folding cofactor b [Chrysochromulina sp. CCMP291]